MKGGFTLLASVFLVLFIGIMVGICLFRSQLQITEVSQRRDMGQAFYAADAGMQNAIASLKQNINFPGWTSPQPLQNSLDLSPTDQPTTVGYYEVPQIKPGPSYNSEPTLWVLSLGQNAMPNQTWNTSLTTLNSSSTALEPLAQTRALAALMVVQNPAAYFIFTLANLTISSGADMGGSIFANDLTFNVDGSLPVSQRGITVNGNITYLGYVSPNPPTPPISVNGTVLKSSAVNFPSVDTNFYFQNTCDDGQTYSSSPVSTCTGGKNLGLYVPSTYTVSTDGSGNLSPSSLCFQGQCSANGVVFASGDINIGNVNVSQPVLVVSGGDIHITGNITATGVNQIGLFAKGNVYIDAATTDTLTIQNAYIDADGGLFQDLSPVRSPGSTLNFTGAISARGVPTESSAILLSTYNNRNYTYDTNLSCTNCSGTCSVSGVCSNNSGSCSCAGGYNIPLGPLAIVSVLKWEEVNPNSAFPPTS